MRGLTYSLLYDYTRFKSQSDEIPVDVNSKSGKSHRDAMRKCPNNPVTANNELYRRDEFLVSRTYATGRN
jgi:hypothetical protein